MNKLFSTKNLLLKATMLFAALMGMTAQQAAFAQRTPTMGWRSWKTFAHNIN